MWRERRAVPANRRHVARLTDEIGHPGGRCSVIHSAGKSRGNTAASPAPEKGTIMSRISKAVRSHRDSARTRREINRAIERAATPGVRNELLAMAQIQGLP